MSIQNFGKATLRVAKNYTKGYSEVQTKVRDATSNDPWGPTGTQMDELAQMTYNQNDFVEIMEMLDKRLNDKGKNWRHVFKALTVLDYLLHAGSENVVIYFRDNIYIIKTLKEFQYVDDYSKDQGANVRQKAKDITNLLQDESRLREERHSRATMRDRMVGGPSRDEFGDENEGRRIRSAPPPNSDRADRPDRRRNKEEEDLKRAIEESKRLADEQTRNDEMSAEERDLAKAIKLSEEEEEKRKLSMADSNAQSLFDDSNPQPTSSNNPFPIVDPATTPFQQGLQPQFTQMMPQYTSFNPYAQQMQQEAMQSQYLAQQQEWMRQQQEAQMQYAQQEEWNQQQQQQQMLLQQQQQQAAQAQFLSAQRPLMPQATSFGSNNPFAFASNTQSPAFASQPHSPPLASTSSAATASSLDTFSLPSTFAHSPSHTPVTSASAASNKSTSPAPGMQPRPTRSDAEHAHLAGLFANRDDGTDTFGNIGQLRFGHTGAGRLVAQNTAATNNPFAKQQQQQQQRNDQPFFSI